MSGTTADDVVPQTERVGVDPRMRTRRIAVKREAGRRRLRILIALNVILVAILLAWAATRSSLLDIDHVQISGASHTSPQEIERAGGLELGRAMWDVNTSAAAARIRRLPWVRWAKVHRDWPATTRVTVIERKPVLSLPLSDGGWLLVDMSGRGLARVASPLNGSPRLIGVPADERVGYTVDQTALSALQIVNGLPSSTRPQVNAVVRLESGEFDLQVAPHVTVHFGDTNQLSEKVLALATVLQNVDRRTVATIDVRVPSVPALTRTP